MKQKHQIPGNSNEVVNASERRYRRLFETAKDGILILDAKTGIVLDVNPFLVATLGDLREAFIGKAIWELNSFKGIIADQTKFAELQEKEYIRYDDMPLETVDGRRIEVEFVCNAYEVDDQKVMYCNICDITDRKLLKEALQLQGTALQAAANAILITDVSGKIVWINPAFTTLTGYTISEVIGKTPRILKSGHHNDACYRQLWETIRNGKVWSGEFVNKRKDGSLYTAAITITPVRSGINQGEITNFIAIQQDITRRKHAEEQLQNNNRQLREMLNRLRLTQSQIIRQENLRALGQMASGIAHDFNNALAPIVGFSNLLLAHPSGLEDQKKVAKYLQIINTCANDAASVVRRMREFGRKRDTGDTQQLLNLNELVGQTIEHTQPRWKDQAQSIGLSIHIMTDLQKIPLIMAEEFAIREMLTNLIINAVDAMPYGGTITLGTAVDGEFVRLWIRDTGTGMTEEVRQRCFEPFFTTKGEKGTGLGLATLYGIIQRHNGTVDVESKLGHGTTFIIRLPIETTKTAAVVPPAMPTLERKLRVLVVDDEPTMLTVVEACLVEDGHTVQTVDDPATALTLLKEGRFDVVLTDKSMPNMSGEQLADAIHLNMPGMPVILMTGYGDLMEVAGEMPAHINEILSKPFTQSSLFAALARVVPPRDKKEVSSV